MDQLMMRKEKFNDPKYESDYDGLFLLKKEFIREIKNNKIKDTDRASFSHKLSYKAMKGLTDVDVLFKHGEYLGSIKVTIKGKDPEIMNAKYLLYQLDEGRISKEEIVEIKTNKNFVGSDVINSKLDLFNYYGGIKANLAQINHAKNKDSGDIFMHKFPYGWVDYQVLNIMSNYRGTNKNYPIRNAEIGKIVFVSAMKTGRQNVNPSSIITNKNLKDSDVFIDEMSNEHLVTILKAEHRYDVTAELNINDSQEDTTIAMMTQVTSNSTAQGATKISIVKCFFHFCFIYCDALPYKTVITHAEKHVLTALNDLENKNGFRFASHALLLFAFLFLHFDSLSITL